MSAKNDLSNNKAKQFLVQHGEKVAFGACVLVVGIFVVLGRGAKGLDESKTPSTLQKQVVSAKAHIAVDRWAEIEDLRAPDFKLPEKVKEGRAAIDPQPYVSRLIPPAPEPQSLRDDPELLAPSKPLVNALIVALASPQRTDLRDSPLDLLPEAEVEKEEKKQPRSRPRTRQPTNPAFGGYGPEFGYGPEGPESDDPMMAESVEYRKMYPSLMKKLNDFTFSISSSSSAIPESQTIVIGTATLPITDQWIEYKRKFEDAIGFDPMRDRPIYMWYEVQRQDVTEASPDEAAWNNITTPWTYEAWYKKRYGDGPPPIVELAYHEGKSTPRQYDYALTSPIPIILMRDIEPYVLHPDTPKAQPLALSEEEETEDTVVLDPTIGPMGPPVSEESEEFEESDFEDGEPPEFDPETGPAAPLKLLRYFDLKPVNGRKYRYRVRVALVDPNNPLDPASASDELAVEEYGGGYGDDPGAYGGGTGAEVSVRWLSAEARTRVEEIRKADLEDPRNHDKRRVEWRYTDWSEPSDVITVPARVQQVLAGSVEAPDETRVNNAISFRKNEPTGTLAVSQFVPYYAVDVPAEKTVSLGTLLNFEANADVLHPIKLKIKRIENFKFETDTVVLDMRGGEELPGSEKENKITAPGEFLVMDADGQLHIQNELEDLDEFRSKLLIPDDEDIEPEVDPYDEDLGELGEFY